MEKKEHNQLGYTLSQDGLTLLNVTEKALDQNGHFDTPEGVTHIGSSAFIGCIGLTTLFGFSAFSRCIGLTSLYIREGVTHINDYAFYRCTSLTNLDIPNSMTHIGNYAFYRCTNLINLDIPNSVTYIGNWAFSECTRLTTLSIPNSLTHITPWSFASCTGLTTLDIPNSVTHIGNWAFAECTGLTTLYIPISVTHIDDYSFIMCGRSCFVIITDTNNAYELKRMKKLFPKRLRSKVVNRIINNIHRELAEKHALIYFPRLNQFLISLGLINNINNIIVQYAYLPNVINMTYDFRLNNLNLQEEKKSSDKYRKMLNNHLTQIFNFHQESDPNRISTEAIPQQSNNLCYCSII